MFSKFEFNTKNILLLASIFIASFFCFWNLGQYSFGEGDQSTHSLVVQDMVHTGSYLNPTVVGKPYFNKPPLKMWVASLVVKVLGESNLSYRLLDGFLGIGIVALVYLLAFKLFQSPVISFVSVLNLLACRLFLFSHGTRVATQDSAQIFFYILALFPLLNAIKELRLSKQGNNSESYQYISKQILLIGLWSGFGMLCKGLGALIIAPIMFACMILVPSPHKQLIKFYKSIIGLILLTVSPLLFLALLFGSHGDNFLRMLFLTEGLKRATKGFHYVNHKWYYFNAIFKHELTVSPYLLIIGVLICLYQWLGKKKFENGFVLILGVVPIVFYQMMKSKLPWYIVPSFPGLSMMAGVGLVTLFQNSFLSESKYLFKKLTLGAFACYGLWSLSVPLYSIAKTITTINPEYPLSRLAHELESQEKEPSIGIYKLTKFAKNDQLYFRMLNANFVSSKDQESIESFKASYPKDLIVSQLSQAPELTSIHKPRGYLLLPFYGRRRKPAIALWYKTDGPLPESIKPWCTTIDLASREVKINKGWAGSPAIIHGVPFRATRGLYSNILFEGDGLLALYPLSFKTYLAATALGASSNLNKIQVSINDTNFLTIKGPIEGFNYYSASIPKNIIQSGINLISFRHMLDPQTKVNSQIQSKSELSFISEISLCPE